MLLFLTVQFQLKGENPKVEKGFINLKCWNFSKDGNIALDGEWEFFWKKFVNPDDTTESSENKYFTLPNLWNNYNSSEKPTSGFGYATYRIRIILPEKDRIFAFHKGQIFTASKIFVNDMIVYEKGKVSESKSDFLAKDYPDIFFYYAKNDTITLTIQVSNFTHQKGGIKNSIFMGYPENIVKMQSKKTNNEYIILGILILIVISQLALFFFHEKEITYLLFGLACLFSIIVLILEGEFILLKIFPDFSQSLIYKLHYSTNFIRVPLFAYFLSIVFNNEISKKITKALLINGFMFSAFTLVTQPSIFTHTINFFMLITLLTFIYLLYGLIKAAINKKEGSLLSLTGFLVLFITAINDILNDRLIIQTFSMVSYGAAAFIIAQSAIMSFRFTKLFRKNEKLTVDLKNINDNLENLVIQRTAQIEQQKEEITAQAEFLANANQEINNKNKELALIN